MPTRALPAGEGRVVYGEGGGRRPCRGFGALEAFGDDRDSQQKPENLLALGGFMVGREDDRAEQLELATALVADEPVTHAKATV